MLESEMKEIEERRVTKDENKKTKQLNIKVGT